MTDKDGLPVSTEPATAGEAFAIAEVSGDSLQHRLDVYSGYSKGFYPEVNKAYEGLIGRIHGLKKAGPALGTIMPDFLLPDHEGKLIGLACLISEGPIVLSLNRGHWCPWCRLQLRALAQINNEVVSLGAQIVSIIPETLSYSRSIVEENKLSFKVLTDLDLGYTLSLGLAIWVGDQVRTLYQGSGLDLALFQNNEGWLLPLPATFILGAGGKIIARSVEPDFRKRMEPHEILAALGRQKK